MSMLCGFWGNVDPLRLESMAERLAHRRTGKAEYHSFGDSLHVAYGDDACSNSLSGVVENGDTFLALAGMPSHSECQSIAEILTVARRRGIAFLDELGGPFVGIFVSGRCRYLFRDKAGRRTMYHSRINGRYHFAIESRAIYTLPDFTPEILPSSVAQYLTFSFVPGENTMLRGIREIPAGCFLENQFESPTRYFFPEHLRDPVPRSDAEWIAEFNTSFQESIRKATPPGLARKHVFLSGGIDSSIVTAALAENFGADTVQAHAIHFGEHYPNELPFAREVARHCGIDCEEVEINPRHFIPVLHDVVAALNDPIGDPVTMPNFLLARHVSRQGVNAVFNGEGGDPLFGGPKNMTMLLHHWYGNAGEANHREKAYLSSYRRGYEELETLLTGEMLGQINRARDLEAILTPFFNVPVPESFLKKLFLINMRLKGAHLILPKVERMLGANGITPLSPLFDESMIELSMILPGNLLLKNGIEKIILKEAFRGRLPDSVIDRPKSGMRVPVHYWFKGEMKRYARKILSPRRIKSAGIFDPERVRQLLNYDTEEGPGRYGIRLWMLLTFELWREQVFGKQ